MNTNNNINDILENIELEYSKIENIEKNNIVSNFLEYTYKEIEKTIDNYQTASESENKNLIECFDDILRINIQLLRRSKEKLKEEINNLLSNFYFFFTSLITKISLKKINPEDLEIQLINSIQSLLEKDEISSKDKIFKSFYELINTQLNQVFFSRETTNFNNVFSCLSSLIHYLDYFSNETTGGLLKILFQSINEKLTHYKNFQTEGIINGFFNTLKMAAFHLNIFTPEGQIELINIIKNQLDLCKNSENCDIKNTRTTAFETLDLIANYNASDVKSFEQIKEILISFCINKEDLENKSLAFIKESFEKQNITLQNECTNSTTTEPSFKQTTSKHESEKNRAIENHPLEFAGAIGHGVLSGIINGSIQYFSNKNSASKQNNFMRLVIIYTGLLANATLAATFPVILSKIEKLYIGNNDEEAERLLNTLYTQALPTFFTSLGFSVALQLVKQCTEVLNQSPKIKSFIQHIIPVMGTSVGFITKPLPTLTQLATATATSSLTYFGLNKFFPIVKQLPVDIEAKHAEVKYAEVKYDAQNNDVTLQLLNKETSSNHIIKRIQNNLTPVDFFFKKIKFINSIQFVKLKIYLSDIISQTRKLQDSLSDQEHSNRLGKILDIPETKQGLLYDLMDLEAFPKKFETEYNKYNNEPEESTVIKNNLNYFKTLIKTIYDKLLTDDVNHDCLSNILCSIKNKNLKEKIIESINFIEDNLGFIRTIIKPIITIYLSQEPTEPVHENGTAILLRQGNNGVNYVNKRYTYHANSDSDMRFSSASRESSTLSESSSRDEEDAQISRILLK